MFPESSRKLLAAAVVEPVDMVALNEIHFHETKIGEKVEVGDPASPSIASLGTLKPTTKASRVLCLTFVPSMFLWEIEAARR